MTGLGKPRLTANNLAQVPQGKAPSTKAADEDEGGLFGAGLFDNAPAAKAASIQAADDGQPASSDWSKEQDERLMELKGENKSWADIATAVDKKEHECKERFKQIKPKDWKPINAKGGGGGKQTKDKQKNKREEKQQDGDKRDEDDKNGAADGSFDANAWLGGGDNTGKNDSRGNSNDKAGVRGNDTSWNDDGNRDANWGGDGAWGVTDGKSEKKDDIEDQWGGGGWDNADNEDGDKKADVGSNNNEKGWGGDPGDNAAMGARSNDDWGAIANVASKNSSSKKVSSSKDSSSNKGNKRSSDQAASQTGYKHRSSQSIENAPTSSPKQYELKPDSTFSADDLRLIAKILQQDCSMVWNRVSWRFKDKTGRNLHPDVFEKKITGMVEDGGSER